MAEVARFSSDFSESVSVLLPADDASLVIDGRLGSGGRTAVPASRAECPSKA
jgi:hypothetical protein